MFYEIGDSYCSSNYILFSNCVCQIFFQNLYHDLVINSCILICNQYELFSSKLDWGLSVNPIFMKKCSTAERFIRKEITSYKIHTLIET